MKYYHSINLEDYTRPRLCELLDKSMEFPVITIEAGTGFGKSVALTQYLEAYQKDYLLMRLNHMDNIPEQFWMKYTKIVAQVDPESAEALENLGFPFTHSELSNCLHLIAKNAKLKKDLCFIMDGFHLITEPSILYFVQQLLCVEIENLHIIIVAAFKHYLNLLPLYDADLVFSVAKEDLCFTKEEIGDYFSQLGINHNPGIITNIHTFTEGWAFAIKLFAFYLKNNPQEQNLTQMVLPTIFDLMNTFAFKSYSQTYKKALIALSYLHMTPVQLVMSITGFDYKEVIKLVESNPFIRYETSSNSIELHKIYLRFLKSQRIHLSEEEIGKLQDKIAHWNYENGHVYEALDFYKMCNNYEMICRILPEFKNKRLSYDMANYLLKLIHVLPEDILQVHEDTILYKALFLFNNNRLTEARDLLQDYELKLTTKENNIRTQELLGETYLMLGLIQMFLREGNFAAHFKHAAILLEKGSQIFDRTYPLLEINHGLMVSTLKKEDVEHSLQAFDEGFSCFVELTHGCGAGLVELARGEYEFLKCNFRLAEKYLYEALFHAKEHLQADIVLHVYYLLMRNAVARGNPELALECLDKIKDFKEQDIYPNRDYPLIDIAVGWVALKVESAANIANWLVTGEITANDVSKRNEGRNLTLYAHWLLLIKQSPSEALAYIEKIEKIFKERNLIFSLVSSYQLKYSAYKMLGRPAEECFKLIEKVYDLIHESDFIMFAVEHGSSTRSSMMAYKKYKDRKIPDEWIDRVITKSTTYSKYVNTFKLKYQKSVNALPTNLLTNNEKALLDGLCYGLSRAEIAEENRITENTVKSQLKTIYNKLNATNQAEAVYVYTSIYLSPQNQ